MQTARWLVVALFVIGCDGPVDPGTMDSGGRDGGGVCAGMADGTSCGAGMVCMSERCVAASGCGNGIVDSGEQCDDGNDTAFDGCEPDTCVPTCSDDAQCDDDIECTGAEACSPCGDESCAAGRRCVSGAPLADSTPCALDAGETGVCRSSVCVSPQCGNETIDAGESCDDGNTTPEDGCEIDCRFTCEEADTTSPNTWYPDCDGDDYAPSGGAPQMACLEPALAGTCGWTLRSPATDADCADDDAAVHPGAAELCDGVDNDCAGGVDNACSAIPCTDGSGCPSGFCADGICCDTACNGQCEACDVTPGTCSQVTGAPHGARAACAGDGTICGGTCGTSRTQCDYPASMCRSQSCTGAVVTLAASCDGAGACPGATLSSCEAYACNSTGSACRTTCSVDADCASGNYCNGGVCLSTKPRGYTCSAGAECTMGYCADGYCCDSACNGQCERCDAAGLLGTCSPATGTPVGTRPACASDHGTCGGTCNGVNRPSCTYPSGVSCDYCTTGGTLISRYHIAYDGGTCNGAGVCAGGFSETCGNYTCAVNNFITPRDVFCRTSCTADSQCREDTVTTNYYCRTSDGTCQSMGIIIGGG